MKKFRKSAQVLVSLLLMGAVVFAACAEEEDKPIVEEQPEEKQVTLTFMDGDSVYKTVTGKAGDAVEGLTLPVKTGYEFGGWLSEGSEFNPSTLPEEDVTVYATYTANPYTIVLASNGGVGADVTVNAVYDTSVNIPDTGFYKTGYTLAGWASTADAEVAEYNVKDSLLNLTAEKNARVTLYAVYNALPVEEGFVKSDGQVLAYMGEEETVTLPSDCTSIAAGAFANNLTLKEVIIPDTYTEIGFGAFEGCDNLEKITVPFIGGGDEDSAFLAYIFGAATYSDNTFSYNVTDIGTLTGATIDENSVSGSFYIPRSLRIVVINAPITEIPEGAFYYAYGLEKVITYSYTDDETPDEDSVYYYHIKKVGDSAFEGCHKIGYDEIANTEYCMNWLSGVETFGKASFKGYVSQNDYYTSNLLSLGVLTSVKNIGEEAFMYDNMLCDFQFGDELETIGARAFANVSLLQRVEIPDSCTYIGEGAFEQCIYLASVSIGSGVEYIGDSAFAKSAALTEVFFKGSLPEEMASNAFYGLDISDENFSIINDVNPGFVFYFDSEELRSGSETKLKVNYPSAQTDLTKEERGPLYYISSSYDFMMTFTGGHTMVINDPLYRTGFGIPVLVGTYEKITDVLYDAEIYNLTLLLSFDFTIGISYYLTATYTHFYTYRVPTFTMSQVNEEITTFSVGDKQNDEWYLEENAYGQIGLWHYGEFFDLVEGATYVVGGIAQYYADNGMRTLVYKQGNEYFEEVLSYSFIYIPDPDIEDGLLTYYGTLYLDNTDLNLLFGNYVSADGDAEVYVDEQVRDIEITLDGTTVLSGTYTTESVFGADEYAFTVRTEQGKDVTLRFTDYLENVTDGEALRNIYARCRFTVDGKEYVLYNTKYSSFGNSYYVKTNGELSDDRYVLIQYQVYVSTEFFDYYTYPGFGEHIYTFNNVGYHEYLTYIYSSDDSGVYFAFETESGKSYKGTVTDEFLGKFQAQIMGTSGATRVYTPYYEDEHDEVFTDGVVSFKLSGYGTAVYTDENGNAFNGYYNIASDTVVGQLFITENTYYYLYEYVFKSEDESLTIYFVPIFYDAYDGSMSKGDMLQPDETRNKTYRIYDRETGICTGTFASSGYGMGIFYILIYPDGSWVPIDSYSFGPGATYAYYSQVGEQEGQPIYRLYDGLDKGFFTFVTTDTMSKGHSPEDMSNYFAYDMIIGEEYEDWWVRPAAYSVTGDISPSLSDLERMPSREEKGTYSAPNGYTLTLDGLGNAELKDQTGKLVHSAQYVSEDAGILGVTVYPFVYTFNGVTYRGTIDIESSIICVEFDVNGVVLSNFAKGETTNYVAASVSDDYGMFTLYAGNYVGQMLVVEGVNTYNMGSYEVDDDGNYTFRFDDKKMIVTLAENGTYSVSNYYRATRMETGDYDATVYNRLSATEEGMATVDFYGYDVKADPSDPSKPLENPDSEYAGTLYMITDGETPDLYWYGNKFYEADIVLYEDGELTITYIYLDIISITNNGWYYQEIDENGDETYYFVLDRDIAIILYTWVGVSVG